MLYCADRAPRSVPVRLLQGAAGALFALPLAAALAAPKGESYQTPSGAIRIVGYNDMDGMFTAWVKRFRETHPDFDFQLDLRGTRFAPEALAKGDSALAPMGAEFTTKQWAAYRAADPREPLCIRVAHASLAPAALSGPLAIVVHRDNPLHSLTLPQVARVFSGEITRWGELGLKGKWASRPIRLAGVVPESPLALFLQKTAMQGRTFAVRMTGLPQSAEVTAWVAKEADGIGYAAGQHAGANVKMLALALREGDAAIAPTTESIANGRYPLDRHLLIYARAPLAPWVREFLKLVLSHEGQQMVSGAPQHYLPLSVEEAATERAKLD